MLTNDDIEVLIDALDACQQHQDMKLTGDVVSANMIGLIMTGQKEKLDSMIKEHRHGVEIKMRTVVKEQVVLLKAKLIQMKDKNDLGDVKSFIKNVGGVRLVREATQRMQ
jgi:predicted nucleotidyltransferase